MKKFFKKRKILTDEILWFLRDMVELIPYPFEGKYGHLMRLRYYERHKVSRAIWDLSNQGLVRKIKKSKKIYIGITDLGRAKSIKYAYRRLLKKAKTNGYSTIITFDIPEEKRSARKFLHRFLLENGFITLQKSVFIGPWQIDPRFKDLLKELKIETNVRVIEGKVLYF